MVFSGTNNGYYGRKIMWQIITIAGLVTFFLRTAPAFFKSASRLQEYPRITKFLDYTICLISGEVVYNVAFKDIPDDSHYVTLLCISLVALSVAGVVMWRTASLMKSFATAAMFFIVGYILLS